MGKNLNPAGGAGGDAVITVAANDTPAAQKDRADFTCAGANDEATIQALVAAGVTVKLMVGTFVFGAALDILVSNFRLEGSGPGTVISGAIAVTYIKIGNNSVALENVEIADLRIDGSAQTGGGHGIETDGVSDNIHDILIENVRIEDPANDGIKFNETEDSRITGCSIYDATTKGIHLRDSHHNNIVGNTCSICAHGIYTYNSAHLTITGNLLRVCGSGIFIQGDAITVTSNECGDGTIGIEANSALGCSIVGNTIKGMGQHGIAFDGSNSTITGNTLLNCSQDTDNTYQGIRINDTQFSTISHNSVRSVHANEPQYCICETGYSQENQYFGNSLYNWVTGPIYLNVGNRNSMARGNFQTTVKWERKMHYMKNTSGGALIDGHCVIFKSVAAGDEVDTTVAKGDDKVFGMVFNSAVVGLADNAYGQIMVEGWTDLLKVDGTDDIAVGDFLCTFTVAGIACKAAAGDMVFAIALEAYTGDDSNGVIDALLIVPRKI